MFRLATTLAIPALAAATTCGDVDMSGVKLISFDVYAALADLGTSLNDNINEVMDGIASTSTVSSLVSHWEGYYTYIKYVSGMAQNDVLFGEGTVAWGGDDRFQTFLNISLEHALDSTGLTDLVDDATFVELTDCWQNLQAWPNTIEALSMLRNATDADGNPQFELAIMSNGDCEGLTHAADNWYGEPYYFKFDHVFCSSNVGMFKPEYDFYQQSVAISGFDQSEILHVAGASFDVTGAKAADLHCAHNQVQEQSNGVNWMDEAQYEVDCYFPTLLDLAEAFTGQTAKSGAEEMRADRFQPVAVEADAVPKEAGDIDTSSTKLVGVDVFHSMVNMNSAMAACAEGVLTPLGVDASVADTFASKFIYNWEPLRDTSGMGRNPDIAWSTGNAFDNWVAHSLASAVSSAGISDVATTEVKADLTACWSQLAPRDGVLDDLAAIQGLGYKVGALSFANSNTTTALLDSWGFDFDLVVSAEDAEGNMPAFPDAQLFDAFLTKSGLTRDEIVFSGGVWEKAFGAKVFGFQAVGNTIGGGSWINWTGNDEYDLDATVSNMDGLVSLLS